MYEDIFSEIKEKSKGKDRFLICVDGKCGSGKTVFCEMLQKELDTDLVHIDYFYLPIKERPENFDEIPRGNMDLRRFEKTVLQPFKEGKPVTYYRFQNMGQYRAEDISLTGRKILVIDGSYSMHPNLENYYDLKIFMTCSDEKQTERLKKREGDRYEFFKQWVGKEIFYHRVFDIESKADMLIDTTELF